MHMAVSAETVSSMPECETGRTLRHVAQMCWAGCNAFLDWERDWVLKRGPCPEALQQHRQDLKWLIRTIKLLHTVTSDPEFPDQSVANDFQVLLDRLNDSWRLVHDPGMSEEEADQILRECFPHGSGA
jgi:hypothetical protein